MANGLIGRVSRGHLVVTGMALLLIGPTNHDPWVSVGSVAIGTVLLAWGIFSTTLPGITGTEVAVAGFWGLLIIFGILGRPFGVFPLSQGETPLVGTLLAAAAASVALLLSARRRARLAVVALALMGAVVIMGTMISQEWEQDLGSDVYHAHRAAGAALDRGENPYGPAVRFFDGNPFHPGDAVIEGYPYPPVVLATFGLSSILTDPRVISTIALFVFLGWLSWRVVRPATETSENLALSMLLLFAVTPLAADVWYMAWSEPLTLALFLGAFLTWKRPWIGGILLGLALASKQYLLFLAPLILLHRDDGWVRRASVAISTATATLAVPLVADPPGFIVSLIGNTSDIGFRPDTLSLSGVAAALGFELTLPVLVWIPLGLLIGGVIARGSDSVADFAGRAGLTLAAVFLIGMAFPNYWFLISGLLAIGIALAQEDGVRDEPQPQSKMRARLSQA
jgi:hypothetical protein